MPPRAPRKPDTVGQYSIGESLTRYARQEQAMRNSVIGFKGDF